MKIRKITIIACFMFIAVPFSFAQSEDNAAVYYEKAFSLYQPFTLNETSLEKNSEIKAILENGWVENRELEGYLKKNESALHEFKKGLSLNKCDFAFGKEYKSLFERPIPNLLKIRNLSTLVMLQGRWYEREKDYSKAIDTYLSLLKFAQQIAQDHALVTKMIEIAIDKMAYKPIKQYLNRPDVSKVVCAKILKRLNEIEKTNIHIAECLKLEKQKTFEAAEMLRDSGLKSLEQNTKINQQQRDSGICFFNNEFMPIVKSTNDKYFDPFINAAKTHSKKEMDLSVAQITALTKEFGDDPLEILLKTRMSLLNPKNLNRNLANKLSKLYVAMMLPNLTRAPEDYFKWEEEFNSLKKLAEEKSIKE